ncbi:MAG: tail fiber domain-containing protein [Pantoea sp. Morm]|nr:tail fiber domain-containing protein [Pantoea sp. Morm]
MSAGTIALTNNSATVTGTGTSFTTELKPGDFVYVTVGGAPYTLVASTVTSDTQLTLAVAFDGPTTSGLAWNAVPASLQVAITQKILNDFAQVARGRILDFQNWQKIYSSDQSVTVTRPDRTTFTGPSWGYMATQFGNKLDKAQNLNDLTDKGVARTNLGLGDSATKSVGTTSNTVAAGDDSRLGTINNKTGGTISSNINVQSASAPNTYYSPGFNGINTTRGSTSGQVNSGGVVSSQIQSTALQATFSVRELVGTSTYALIQCIQGGNTWDFRFQNNGNAYASGTWTNGSDRRFKDSLEVITGALGKVKTLTGYTGKRDGMPFTGLIAQDLQGVLPEAVFNTGPYTLKNDVNDYKKGEVIPDALAVAYGDTVGLLVEAIKELSGIVDNQNSAISELQQRMKAIDGLDA